MNLNELNDKDLLALCIMGEARGEPVIGKLAVAHVVLNRAAHPGWWGHDVKSVLLKKYQFSCFLDSDPNRAHMGDWLKYTHPGMETCLTISELSLAGLTTDPTDGATHYHEQSVKPEWASKLTFVKQIGRHRFYR
jgi:N-acetylmuramoyl-L-alanine amidase